MHYRLKTSTVPVILTLAIAVFTVFLQISPLKEKDPLMSSIYFLAILGFIVITYLVNWLTEKFKSYVDQIKNNSEEIEVIKGKMGLEGRFAEIDKRIAILETFENKSMIKGKKGQSIPIDPRWVLVAILLLLFFLYLRSLGIF